MSQVRIAVAEDDPVVSELMFDMLQSENRDWEVLSTCNGEEALKLVKEMHPHLVVTALNMPRMDGLELCRMVTKCFSIPVIIVTALGNATTRVSCFEAGASAYVVKPFSREDFLNKVRIVLCQKVGYTY